MGYRLQHCEQPSAASAVTTQTVDAEMAELWNATIQEAGAKEPLLPVCLRIELHYSSLIASVERDMSLFNAFYK